MHMTRNPACSRFDPFRLGFIFLIALNFLPAFGQEEQSTEAPQDKPATSEPKVEKKNEEADPAEVSGQSQQSELQFDIEKQKDCLILIKTPTRLKAAHRYEITLPDETTIKAAVKKASDKKAQLILRTPSKKCPSLIGKAIKIKLDSAEKISATKQGGGAEASADPQKSKLPAAAATDASKTPGASQTPPAPAQTSTVTKEYRVNAGGGYGQFFQNVQASNSFIAEAKKEKIGSIGGPLFYAGLGGFFPIGSAHALSVTGRYLQFSAKKDVELGGGSPSFKYSVKATEYQLRAAYILPQCFGLGFACGLSGMGATLANSTVLIGAVDQPPPSPMTYMRFGGGLTTQFKLGGGFVAHIEVEGTMAQGTLNRADTQKKFTISPQLISFGSGIEFSL
ncbi:MAG: hypothetical protein RL189_2366 [Pseudomonadota bacterium]